MQTEEIKILWEGPFDIETIINDKIDKDYETKASDIGIYQIYGSHPLYGDSVLVYIGRTKNKHGFKKRLKDRWVIQHGSDNENIKIYLGTIMSDTIEIDEKIKEDMIKKSEELLIYAMKPAYNSSNIQSVNNDLIDHRFIIHNEGNYRSIYPVLDSKYFLEIWQNYKLVDNISNILNLKIDEVKGEYYGINLNKKYNISDDYIIWIGIDEDIWTKFKIPFVLEIYSTDKKIMKKIKLMGIGKYHSYEDEDMYDVCYLNIDDNIFSLDKVELENYLGNKVKEIMEKVKF